MPAPTQSVFNPETASHAFMMRFRSLPFYLVAVLLHVLFLLIFGTYSVSERGASVITQFTAPEQKVAPGPPPPPPPPPPEQKKQTPVQTAQAKSMAPRPTMISTPLPSAAMVIPVPTPVPQMDMKSLAPIKNIQVNTMYGQRLNTQTRTSAIGRYGGGATKADQLEGAVYRALNWLQKSQNPDGSWGGSRKASMTGLALLTMLAHGETQTSKQYGETVQKGVQWLMDTGRKNKNVFAAQNVEYQHAIATYALAEDYALTQIGDLLTVLEGAVEKIVTSQSPTGAWEYGYNNKMTRPDERPFGGDLSISGWNIQALKAAKNAGVRVKGLDEAMRKALDFCKAVYDDKTHRFGYAKKGGGSEGLLGVGILSMMFLGAGDSKEARGAIREASAKVKCDWSKAREANSYVWYYITQAMFQGGGSYWVSWNREFRDTLLKNQMADGHWTVPGSRDDVPVRPPNADEKWHAQVGDPKDSPVYHTTMLCMMLEVYYRFLPTFK
ncbi:MAG: DUF6288 domain-containing protein [Verrucomicrobiia bacterium]